jgi:hydroxyethylthiazole kinase
VAKINTQIAEALSRIKEKQPLIHHITNTVAIGDTATLTLHLGALPIMATAAEEVAEMTSQASALVLNIGTLSSGLVQSMLLAGRKANELGIPIVLDPVGAGATRLRTHTSARLLDELAVAVVRGNEGAIGMLSGAGVEMKGVESVKGVVDPPAVAGAMARSWKAVVAITGKRDVVSDGKRVLAVENSHVWLQAVSGTGCLATAAIAAFAAVERNHLIATVGALAAFGLAAELAAKETAGPSSFKIALFDSIYNLTPERLEEQSRIVSLKSD